MFFDHSSTDTRYQELLLLLAQKQRQLLECHFNWPQREARTLPQKQGIFGRKKKKEPYYEKLSDELASVKEQIKTHRKSQGYPHGIFWWELPWEQIEAYLIYDLSEPKSHDNWRWERHWELSQNQGVNLLLLREEGHCSIFSSHVSIDTRTESPYSSDEIKSKLRNFNHKVRDYELEVSSYEGPVRSLSFGIDYDSGADYLTSTEHYLHKQFLEDKLKRSLYTEYETTTTYAQSNSLHYECIFAVAKYHETEGCLDYLSVLDYELCGSRGQTPSDVQNTYLDKDAAVACAAYLADNPQITSVPIRLFCKDMAAGATDYNEAMRQAQLYTCLAYKISA